MLSGESRQVSSLNGGLQQGAHVERRSETLTLVNSQLLPIEGFVRPGDSGAKMRSDSLTKEVGQGLHDLPWLEE